MTYGKFMVGATFLNFVGIFVFFPMIFNTKIPFFNMAYRNVSPELGIILYVIWVLFANTLWYFFTRG